MIEPIDYMQTDSRWAYKPYQAPGEKSTIKKSGCGITCAAMIIASLADKSITPADTAKWSMAHGYKAYRQGTYYSYFEPQLKAYGIECEQLNTGSIYHNAGRGRIYKDIATDAVADGDWIICCMGKGDWTSSGHFILWYGIDKQGNALIRDPNSKKASRRCAAVDKLIYQTKYLWRVETEQNMTQETFNEMFENAMNAYLNKQSREQPAEWSKEARDWGYNAGIMTGGAYKRFTTREELIQVIYAYNNKLKDEKF